MAKKVTPTKKTSAKKQAVAKKTAPPAKNAAAQTFKPAVAPATENVAPEPTPGPQFGEPSASPDPSTFVVKHGSDSQSYKILDSQKQNPRPFPVTKGTDEPVLKLQEALASSGPKIVSQIESAGQIVFHAVGDTGSTKGPADEDGVANKMVSDYDDTNPREVPSFFMHLGDIVYSFGEAQYYYDQFYDVYRNYPAPIFAIAGNHDGMVAPRSDTPTLAAFLDNFCAAGKPFARTPEAGALLRTAQIQPGVYYTLEAPYVRILTLYSNCLEDPGVISSEGGKYPYLGDAQLAFLKAALQRTKDEKFAGAILIAVHHPPYVAVSPNNADANAGKHGASLGMLKEIDAVCKEVDAWPHAVLSGHAHNYQRFTRTQEGRETPFIVSGNGGHAVGRLSRKGMPTLRTPSIQSLLSDGTDEVMFESYDDGGFGYLRIIANQQQLRLEYHPCSDGANAKTPDDSVTVDLAQRKLVHYRPQS